MEILISLTEVSKLSMQISFSDLSISITFSAKFIYFIFSEKSTKKQLFDLQYKVL